MFSKLFSYEFCIDDKYQPIATAVVAIFAVVYAVSFLGLMQYVAYLGPGLGDDLNFTPFLSVLQTVQGSGSSWLYYAFILLCCANVLFTAAIVFLGYWLYPKALGKPFPVQLLFTYFAMNAVCTVGIWSIQGFAALFAPLMGYSVLEGIQAFASLLSALRDWANQVPTLVDMPAWMAFLVLQMLGGFFHYWFHRLAHESRILWLLFHRTHHMTPELIQPSTQAVFNAFPFFIFAAIPYVLIFSLIGKLITADSLLMYLIIYKLFSAFANLWSHQSALYSWAQKQWPIRVLSTITSEGVYHYLHHSAELNHNRPRGNLINIGGGLCFIWDRVFGTYVPVSAHKPAVGLAGVKPEEMSTNPLRLALAGTAQLLFELRHNPDPLTWLKILFGPSDYLPPHSKDYIYKASYSALTQSP